MEALEALAEGALAGRGSLVLVGGESGVGKTYLLAELSRRATPRGLRVVVGECQAQKAPRGQRYGSGRPLHPLRGLIQVVLDLCVTHEELGPALLEGIAPVLAPYFPDLAALPLLRESPELPELPPQAARDRLFSALNQLISALAARHPLLLILDDLQWADELTLGWLSSCAAGLRPGVPLLLLGAYRSQEQGELLLALEQTPGVHALQVPRLDDEDTVAVAGDMLGCAPDGEFGALLARLSGGNPFFVAEYLRVAVAEGLLVRGPRGHWEPSEATQAAGGYEALGLPGDLRTLILRRLRALSPHTYRLAEIASVLGREVDTETLDALGGLSPDLQMESLQELLARHIFEEHEAGHLRFVHDKIHENIYESIEAPRRRDLHLQAARLLERRHRWSPTLATLYPVLATHHQLGGNAVEAANFLELAANQALGSFANREAAEYFRRLLELVAAVKPAVEREASWRRGLGLAQFRLGRMADTITEATRSLRLLGHELPTSAGGWGLRTLRELGVQAAHRLAEGRLRAPAGEQDRTKEAALAMELLTECWYFTGEMQTLAGGLASVNLAERSGHDLPRPYAALGGVAGLSNLGGLARRYFDLSRETAQRRSDPAALIYSHDVEASWLIGVGDWGRACALGEQAVALADGLKERRERDIATALLGHVDHFCGRPRESLQRFEAVAVSARERGDEQLISWGLCGSARALLALDRPEEARPLLEEALSFDTTEIVPRIDAPGLLGAVYERLGRHEEALEMARTALRNMARKPPVMFFMATEGISCTAQTFLDTLQRSPPAQRRERAREAREGLTPLLVLSLNVPIARPALGRLAAQLARAHGQEQLASRLRARGLAAARRLGMPREVALLEAAEREA
jgi:tetratricopeptide (TPR) repeat protein